MTKTALRPALLASLALAPLLLAAPAQADAPAPTASAPTLTLTAEGHSTRTPDVATFTAGVSTTGTSAAKALASNAAAMIRRRTKGHRG